MRNWSTTSEEKLKKDPTLKDFQDYISEIVKERGFDKAPIEQKFMGLLEECGEMAKAAKNVLRARPEKNSEPLDYEIADVFIFLLDICNRFGVDLEKAFRAKEEINKKRIWKN